MLRKIVRLSAQAVGLSALLLATSASAGVLLGEKFERGPKEGRVHPLAVQTREGWGWRPKAAGEAYSAAEADVIVVPAAGRISAQQGTVELNVVRDNGEQDLETYFSLAREDGYTLLSAAIWWKGRGPYKRPVLQIHGSGGDLWYTLKPNPFNKKQKLPYGIPLPKTIAPGERFSIIFTWGPSKRAGEVYLDGRRLNAVKGKALGMQRYVEEAAKIVLGGQLTAAREGANAMPRSILKSVYIYDRALDGGDLYRNPRKYRPEAAPVPEVASVNHNAAKVAGFSGKLVAGNRLGVAARGSEGAEGTFDVVPLPGLDGKLALDWRGWGVYLEEKTFFEPGEVNLRDVAGYEVYGSPAVFNLAAPGMEPAARLEVEEQTYTFEFLPASKPYYVAVLARMRDGSARPVFQPIWRQPLKEDEPGVYHGSYQVGWQDRYEQAVVVARLAYGKRAATLVDDKAIALDPGLTIAVATEPKELKADEKSTSKVTVQVANANGDPVAGHKIRFLLATTSQYTGVVGGGAFAEQVGGKIAESFRGETDIFGRISATYVAGFAAKTAVIVARDMLSNSTGAGYVKTFIQAGAQLELLPVRPTEAMMAGYEIEVTSSDDWLTADGKSEARISAKVTLNGKPVEGHAVRFGVTSGVGTIRTVKETTGKDGIARAIYTAGKKIGIVVITATDTTVDISGTVQIELRSDAPAKLTIKIDPEKLPADGRSTADLSVLVTDINDNPNDNTEVEYRISGGGGELRQERTITDKNGETANEYEAGRTPGIVTFELTVRSTVPTDEELAKARGMALAVTDYDFY